MKKQRRLIEVSAEPKYDDKTIVVSDVVLCGETNYKLAAIFNWYRQNISEEKGLDYFLAYVKDRKDQKEYDLISKSKIIPATYCWLARQATIAKLPKEIVKKLDSKVDFILLQQKLLAEKLIEESTAKKINKNVHDYISEQAKTVLSEIDYQFDTWLQQKMKYDFDLKSYLLENSIKHVHISKIIPDIEKIKSEFVEALSGTDDQLNEAYSMYTKAELKKIINYLDEQIETLNNHRELSKEISRKTRRPRTVKTNPNKSVAKLKYKKEDTQYKIISVDPVKIVGAEQLWIFNTKTRSLGVYRTDNVHGLFVKGSTIRNYDTSSSVSKTIRKPEVVIAEVMSGGKIALKKIIENVKAVEKKLNGRINKDCILLRVL